MIVLTGLQALHVKMGSIPTKRASFIIRIYGKPVSIVFLCSEKPYYLHIAALGIPGLSLEYEVSEKYEISSSYIPGLTQWCHYFELEYDADKHFKPSTFWDIFNSVVAKVTPKGHPRYSEILKIVPIKEEKNKPYFLGVRHNTVGSVSPENYEKTRRAFGDTVADHYRKANISTRWTEDIDEECLDDLLRDFPGLQL